MIKRVQDWENNKAETGKLGIFQDFKEILDPHCCFKWRVDETFWQWTVVLSFAQAREFFKTWSHITDEDGTADRLLQYSLLSVCPG